MTRSMLRDVRAPLGSAPGAGLCLGLGHAGRPPRGGGPLGGRRVAHLVRRGAASWPTGWSRHRRPSPNRAARGVRSHRSWRPWETAARRARGPSTVNSASARRTSPTDAPSGNRLAATTPFGCLAPAARQVMVPSPRSLVISMSMRVAMRPQNYLTPCRPETLGVHHSRPPATNFGRPDGRSVRGGSSIVGCLAVQIARTDAGRSQRSWPPY